MTRRPSLRHCLQPGCVQQIFSTFSSQFEKSSVSLPPILSTILSDIRIMESLKDDSAMEIEKKTEIESLNTSLERTTPGDENINRASSQQFQEEAQDGPISSQLLLTTTQTPQLHAHHEIRPPSAHICLEASHEPAGSSNHCSEARNTSAAVLTHHQAPPHQTHRPKNRSRPTSLHASAPRGEGQNRIEARS